MHQCRWRRTRSTAGGGPVLDRSAQASAERQRYGAQFVRAMTGIGAAGASQH
ncbi:hypothetical protein [Cupriavidus alkaliphilus]|uniref:hypothetical protein n=1 Tax=Cupriavidus alkaliphilus TaxID=942866 RepID=UPI0018345393|nr:hypothetical protein [Cupriavidus alkaliphilus]MBB3013288.1 hypothetical protein [Cupriavidus alkaliphilus]